MSFCKHRVMDKCSKDNRPCIFSEECCEPEEEPVMTNADRIRAMSDEELAGFLDYAHNDPCDTCCDNLYWCRRNNAPEPICKRHFLGWLQQPVEEDDHE